MMERWDVKISLRNLVLLTHKPMTAFAPGKTAFDDRSVAGWLFLLSFATIAAAWGFELIGGYEPCPLCLQQRYAYYFALPAALAAFYLISNLKRDFALILFSLCALAYLINAGLGVYHSGVEWHWWAGPSDCAGGAAIDAEAGGLLNKLAETRVIRCDEAPWRLVGLSFAGYNALISLALAALSLRGAQSLWRKRPSQTKSR